MRLKDPAYGVSTNLFHGTAKSGAEECGSHEGDVNGLIDR